MYAKNIRPSAKREVQLNGARNVMIESRALGALKFPSETRDENMSAERADFIFSN